MNQERYSVWVDPGQRMTWIQDDRATRSQQPPKLIALASASFVGPWRAQDYLYMLAMELNRLEGLASFGGHLPPLGWYPTATIHFKVPE